MNDPKAQIVEKLKSANNILVTVSADPSVDQLAACIATTMLLNKFKKNATAVFSGKVPSFLNFLKPGETMEKTTDSLRDFIIALDKSKADKLRYKVEDDVVKIFITPFKTSITASDLKYSAGDFNIDVILALGVHHQQDLDAAITAHGRIFHDAVTMSINNTPNGDFGVANWEDVDASSMSELIANLIDELDPSLLDADIATALLTGIVAETGRFSNDKTHPHTMTVSSRLLEAGANQQLVNSQLQDLIGVVVNLEAGTEIAPTADTSNEPLHHNDVADELIIDENGSFNPTTDDKNAAEPNVSDDAPVEEEPKSADVPELELPVVSPEAAETADTTDAATPSIEEMLGTPVESTPAPVLDEQVETNAADSDTPTPSEIEADAEAARQAIESALVDNQAPEAAEPTPEPVPAMAVQPEANPMIQGIASNQPSYADPNTTTQYDMPAIPAQEPAPLSMSPADQPFTMPMPPAGSMPMTGPLSSMQPLPGNLAGADTSTNGQPNVTPPPPLPPPMMPPSFG